MSVKDFAFGSVVWPGLAKLIEECGEVLQVGGKLVMTGGDERHWDGSNLRMRLEEEIADVLAACEFVIARNSLHEASIGDRVQDKLRQFQRWEEESKHDEDDQG